MSRTRNDEQDERTEEAERAEAALSLMLRQGRSFSAHERHCCFLNTGSSRNAQGRFANVSATTGLDLDDDGRGVALVDWDRDGDLDLWISNRNAPRLRMLLNASSPHHHFLAIRLVGDGATTNRDAIGARVEVYPEVAASPKKLIKTVRAGEAFLSQSSKWLHFGLGDAEGIEKLVVRWPNGEAEEFTDLQSDRHYEIVQGTGRLQTLPPRAATIALAASAPTASGSAEPMRIPLVTRLPLVELAPEVFGVVKSSGLSEQPQAVLVNLWASWCPPCAAELRDFSDHREALQSAGVYVIALSVDGLGDDRSDPAAAKQFLEELKFPFTAGRATEKFVRTVQQFHDRLVAYHRPLPVPSSFLVDSEGRLAVIYKGQVTAKQVIQDVAQLGGSRQDRVVRAALVPGRVVQDPRVQSVAQNAEVATRYQFAMDMLKAGQTQVSARELQEVIKINPDLAEAHAQLGNLLAGVGDIGQARSHYNDVLRIEPENADVIGNLGTLYAREGKIDLAKQEFERALSIDPTNVASLNNLGRIHSMRNEPAAIMEHYRRALQKNPLLEQTAGSLSWILATSRDDALRDGPEAVKWAKQALQVAGGDDPRRLDQLAAAYAEANRFEEAVATSQQALQLARAKSEHEQLAREIAARLDLYRQGRPFRQP